MTEEGLTVISGTTKSSRPKITVMLHRGGTLVWKPAASCFSSGGWIGTSAWNGDAGWKG